MNVVIAWLIFAFLVCLCVSLFYWHVLHKVALERLRFRLFAQRDELRCLALRGIETSDSFCFKEAAQLLNSTLQLMPSVSLASFCWYAFRTRSEPTPSDSMRYNAEASEKLKSVRQETIERALTIMALNSPLLCIAGAFAVLVTWLTGVAKEKKAAFLQDVERYVKAQPVAGLTAA
ncbi:MAG TPA: hypothetical protein VFT34_12990 [Verrucomicrobiae bacterium]|nr:hypothetical protein [Verrucomicrobiae bacterium]